MVGKIVEISDDLMGEICTDIDAAIVFSEDRDLPGVQIASWEIPATIDFLFKAQARLAKKRAKKEAKRG